MRSVTKAALALALLLAVAVPDTSLGVAIVLTPEGGDPFVDGRTGTSQTNVGFDMYLDIGATTASLTQATGSAYVEYFVSYVDDVAFTAITAYQIVLETASGMLFPLPLPAFDIAPIWGGPGAAPITMLVSGNATTLSLGDQLFQNSVGIPVSSGVNGFCGSLSTDQGAGCSANGGFILLGTIRVGHEFSGVSGSPILQFAQSGSFVTDAATGQTTNLDAEATGPRFNPDGVLLIRVPEPSTALLLCIALALAARHRGVGTFV